MTTTKKLTVMIGMVLLLGPFSARAQGPRVLGLWNLDVESSELPAPLMIKSEIRSYAQRGDGNLVVLALRVNSDGSPEFIQVAAKSDGEDNPQYQSGPLAELQINGTPTQFTYSETITDEYSRRSSAN